MTPAPKKNTGSQKNTPSTKNSPSTSKRDLSPSITPSRKMTPKKTAPVTSVPVSRTISRSTLVLVVLALIASLLLGFEYRNLSNHRTSLGRLRAELERRKNLQLGFPENEVASFLKGSPQKQTRAGPPREEYYSWRGLLHSFHICVERGPSGEVIKVDEEDPQDAIALTTPSPPNGPMPFGHQPPVAAATNANSTMPSATNLPLQSRENTGIPTDLLDGFIDRSPDGSYVLDFHQRFITRLLFSPDSRRLVSIDHDGHALIWNLRSCDLEGQIGIPWVTADHSAISPDGRTLITLKPDAERSSILRWDLDSRQALPPLASITRLGHPVYAVTFGPQPNQVLALAGHRETIEFPTWSEHKLRFVVQELGTGQLTEPSAVLRGDVESIVYLPSLNLFAVGVTRVVAENSVKKRHTTVQLWRADFTKLDQELTISASVITGNPNDETNPVLLSHVPRTRRMAAIAQRGTLKVWDIGTWTELLSRTSEKPIRELSMSPDGEFVATTEVGSNAVSVWSVSDGQRRSRWQTDEWEITNVAYSPDGKWVATANVAGTIRLWKNTPEDTAASRDVASASPPDPVKKSSDPKEPINFARNPRPEQFIGKWIGRWDGQWRVQVTVSKKPNSEELELLNEWQEAVGGPLQRWPPTMAKIENDALVSSYLEITLDADDPDVARIVGNFQLPRTALLRRVRK